MTIDPDINDVVMTANHKENVVNAECRETVSEPNLSTSVQTEASLAKIAIIWTALSLVLMLVWLDEGIVATAIPSISDDFNSLHDIGWYASSYLFALSALQLPFGRVYKDFKAKPTFLTCLFVFEIGSIVQASSPSSVVFIIGRALAGIGGAGVITGALVIFSDEFPARYVPFAMGSIGFTYGIGIVAGPILGGVISKSYLTWRWCFWINPIISAVALIPVIFVLKPRKPVSAAAEQSILTKLKSQDWLGLALFLPMILCLLLALEYGSTVATWSDRRTIALLVVSGVLFMLFMISLWRTGEASMLPPRLVKMRVIWGSMQYTAFFDGAFFILEYYLPLWFQAIKGLSPEQSAFHIMPFVACVIVGVFATGFFVGKMRRYNPLMILGSTLLTIGAGLLTTLQVKSSTAQWAIFQVIAGLGAGGATQLPLIAVQDGVEAADLSTALSVVLTCGYLGSSISLSIGQAVFSSRFRQLLKQRLPNFTSSLIQQSGALSVANVVPQADRGLVLRCYNEAVTQTFFAAVTLSGLSLIGACCMKWGKMNDENASIQNSSKESQDSAGKN